MNKVLSFLDGKKSYLVAIALVVYALTGIYTGQMTSDQAIQVILNGLGLGALRSAISK